MSDTNTSAMCGTDEEKAFRARTQAERDADEAARCSHVAESQRRQAEAQERIATALENLLVQLSEWEDGDVVNGHYLKVRSL